jgi:hypothetical protein
MNMKSFVITGALVGAVAFSYGLCSLHAQSSTNQGPLKKQQKTVKTFTEYMRSVPRAESIKTVNFYLRNGELVTGRLVSEDKNEITVEQRQGSSIVLATYSKREVDTRTIHTKNMPEARYYMELAEKFTGSTWDFKNDPDDFIQAIRCYERAKKSLEGAGREDSQRIKEIDGKIQRLQADREVWTREVESRAKLKKLEFEAMFETRLKELEAKVETSIGQADEVVGDVEDSQKRLEERISAIGQDLLGRIGALDNRIAYNRRLIEDLRYWSSQPRYYPYRGPGGP